MPVNRRVLNIFLLMAGFCLFYWNCSFRSDPVFAKDVAPLIHKHCTPCHSPGGAAPFSLRTYAEVSAKAKMIALVTRSGYMPPWPADRHYSSFQNEKALTEQEIERLQLWYKAGSLPGDTAGLKMPDTKAFQSVLGTPDMVIDLQPVTVAPDKRDRFYVLKMPYSIPEPRFVRAVEFVPGRPAYTHHVNGHYLRFSDETDPFAGSRLADTESPDFLTQFEALSLKNRDGSLPERVHSAVNYLPGAFGVRYPAGIGGFVMGRKGAFVANDIHYGPSAIPFTDSSKLYIYFSEQAPERPSYELMMGTNGVSEIVPPLQVPPGTISRHSSRLSIYNDISILTVNPHMHLIGTRFKAYALKPNGDTVKLIHIPRWQFRWQYFYTYKNPVKVPKGSVLVVEAEFDNTAMNPFNPFDPPRHIGERLDRGGASMRTTDEMLQFIITYMPYRKGDETIDLTKP